MSQNDVLNVRKEDDFEAFIKIIEDKNFETWVMVAEALGVHYNTIKKWKKHPLARKAIAEGITNAVRQMETVGKRDWRMWREKIALLKKEEEPEEEKKEGDKNLFLIGDEVIAKYLHGFIKRLQSGGDTQAGQGDANRGEVSNLQ